jgi:Haemolysin XhlA
MTEPSGRELNEKIADIREWLVRIDTKVDYLNEVKHTAEQAEKTADEALALSKENRQDIRDMQTNSKWLWGTIISVFAIIVTIAVAVFN